MHLPLWPIFRQSHPNFINVRTAYASKIVAQLTKNHLTKSGTERFKEDIGCPPGVFHAPAFVADFPPVAPQFYQRTHRVRLKNCGTTDKKSSHKIRHRKIPGGHQENKEARKCQPSVF